MQRIAQLKCDHPFWGYRRVWAWLRYREGMQINAKRVYRLMQENGLLVVRKALRAKRTPQRSKPRATRPREIWGTDMTKIMVAGVGWVYITIVLDWFTKGIVGYHVGSQSRSGDWLEALHMGLNARFPDGCRRAGLQLVSDNGSQPTSRSYQEACRTLGIAQIYTSYNNPRGNAETERMMRTLKEELLWLQEFGSLTELQAALAAWIQGYNEGYVHSALGYRSPEAFEREYAQREAA